MTRIQTKSFVYTSSMMRLWNPEFWTINILEWGICHFVFPSSEFHSRHYFKNITLLLTLKISRNRCFLWNVKMYQRQINTYSELNGDPGEWKSPSLQVLRKGMVPLAKRSWEYSYPTECSEGKRYFGEPHFTNKCLKESGLRTTVDFCKILELLQFPCICHFSYYHITIKC